MLTRSLPLAMLPAALLALAPGHVFAQDARIREVPYQAHTVVAIPGRPNIQSTIVFASDERIENVAVGDSAAWQVTPNKRANLLFVKPQVPRGRTNMTVVTDQRTYLFDLIARPGAGPGGGAVLYTLQFTYPAPPPSLTPAATVEPVAPAAPPQSPADLNFAWTPSGARRLLPRRVFDDGAAVYMAWDADVPLPALLTVSPDGTEGPVNFTVKGDFIVVDGVPGRIVLRAGRERAVLDRAAISVPVPGQVALAAIQPPKER